MADNYDWEDPFQQGTNIPPAKQETFAWEDPFQGQVNIPERTPAAGQMIPRQGAQTVGMQEFRNLISKDISNISGLPDSIASRVVEYSGDAFDFTKRAMQPSNLEQPAIAAGAMLGAAYGAPLGLPGVLGGGVLGAGMSRAAMGAARGEDVRTQVKGIAKEMRDEALFAGGATAIGPAFKLLGPQVGKIFGLTDEGIQQVVRDSERNKVPLALQDVVPMAKEKSLAASIATGYPKVVGVFPFAGTPQRKAYAATERVLVKSVDDTLNAVAPNDTLHQLGIDTYEAAKNMSEQVKSVGGGLYDAFYKTADDLGNPAIVPTAPIKQAIAKIRSAANRPLVGGKPLPRPKIATDFDKYVTSLEQLDEFISPAELRSVQEDINKFYQAANIKGYDEAALGMLKTGSSISMNSMDTGRMLNKAAGEELRQMLDTANQWHAASMVLFGSPAGKRFTKVDKNIFNSKPFQAGGITADQLAPQLLKNQSPQMVKDLRNIVGVKKVNELTGAAIKSAKEKSIANGVFDFNQFEKNLGLLTQEGRDTLQEGLKGSGLTVEKLDSLLRLGKQHGSVEISEASTFLKRRLALTGLTGAASYAVPSSVFISVPTLITARAGSSFLASPKVLRWMTTALDETVNDKIREVAVSQLIDAYQSYDEQNGGGND